MCSFQPEVETGFLTVASGEDLEDYLISDPKEVLVIDLEELQEEKIIEVEIVDKRSIGDQGRTPETDSVARF